MRRNVHLNNQANSEKKTQQNEYDLVSIEQKKLFSVDCEIALE
jgi:hypothetical protein